MANLKPTRWNVAGTLAASIGMMACIGTSPQEQDPAVQGDYDDGDEEHRPGQPCLLCHGPGHIGSLPGNRRLEIAGTVFGFVDDNENAGVEGVTVTVTDATGFEFSAITNRTGNFMFEVDSGRSDVSGSDDGQVDLPREPTYPLSVSIEADGEVQTMKTKIWRNGSCAHCHGTSPSATSVGRVFLFEDTP